MSRIHAAAERRFTPWKNGGGQTAEVLCQPEGAGFDSFDWRISTARVAQSGPFSRFAGVDRVLTVLEGGPMRLRFGDGRAVELDATSAPFAFSGDVGCQADLMGPPLLDLNVMVRRPLRAEVWRLGESAPRVLTAKAHYLFALAPLPALGLERHDLLELPSGTPLPSAAQALAIAIAILPG